MKKSSWIAVFLLCGALTATATATADALTVFRILSLSSAATRVLIKLGTPPSAVDEYGRRVAPPEIPSIGRGELISLEKVVAMKIRHAVVWDYQTGLVKALEKRGVQVLKLPSAMRLRDYPEFVRAVGRFARREEAAEKEVRDFERELAALPEAPANPVRVYFALYSRGSAAGDSSYLGDLVRRAGGRCIVEKSGQISREKLIASKPEVIFYPEGTPAPADPGLEAVRSGRIYAVPQEMLIEGNDPLKTVCFLRSAMERGGQLPAAK